MKKGTLVKYRPLPEVAKDNGISSEYSIGIILESYFLHHANSYYDYYSIKINEYVIFDIKYGMKFSLSDDMFEFESIK